MPTSLCSLVLDESLWVESLGGPGRTHSHMEGTAELF